MWFMHQHNWQEPEGRYQRCDTCGMLRTIECAHSWTNIKEIRGQYPYRMGEYCRIAQQCLHCGEIRRVDLV